MRLIYTTASFHLVYMPYGQLPADEAVGRGAGLMLSMPQFCMSVVVNSELSEGDAESAVKRYLAKNKVDLTQVKGHLDNLQKGLPLVRNQPPGWKAMDKMQPGQPVDEAPEAHAPPALPAGAYCGPAASKAKGKERADKAIKAETESTAKVAKEAAKRQRTADLTAARRGASGKEEKTPKKRKTGKGTGDEDGAGGQVDDSDEKE